MLYYLHITINCWILSKPQITIKYLLFVRWSTCSNNTRPIIRKWHRTHSRSNVHKHRIHPHPYQKSFLLIFRLVVNLQKVKYYFETSSITFFPQFAIVQTNDSNHDSKTVSTICILYTIQYTGYTVSKCHLVLILILTPTQFSIPCETKLDITRSCRENSSGESRTFGGFFLKTSSCHS